MKLKTTLTLCTTLCIALFVAGCNIFEPITRNQAGRVAEAGFDQRDPSLAELSARNKARLDQPADELAMSVPSRDGAGIVGEVDVSKIISATQNPGNKKGKSSPVKLEFTDTSLKDIIVVFMQDYLKQPYNFQDSFKDRKVNLYFDALATKEDLIRLFDTLLDNYGVRLRYSGGVYLIGAGDDKAAPVFQPSPLGIGDAVGVFVPKFIDARDLLQLAKQTVKQGERITALPNNVLLVNSTSTDVRSVASLMQDIDVPAFANKQILVYVPRYLSATSLVTMLENYQTQLSGAGSSTNKQFEAKQVPEAERVIIVAASKAARDLVAQFLNQTDVAGANQRRIFQYVLGSNNLSPVSSGSNATSGPASEIVANLEKLLKAILRNPSELSIVGDKTTNSLFIHATPEEFVEVRKLLRRMDYRPPAIQVDIVIAEVNLTANMNYGVEWYLKQNGKYISDLTGKFGVNSAPASGIALGLVGTNDTYATLQLIGSETSYSLLSSPKIVVKNGATAKIVVGGEQPVIKSRTINNASATGNTVVEPEYKKIGLELTVTPFVGQNNEVRLTINLKDNSVSGEVVLGSDKYPVLSNRELSTDLVVDDGQTIFLGGLRKQFTNDSSNRVPGLADIKWFGAAFRDKSEQNSGQELIILATPTIIYDQQGADIVTRALIKASHRTFDDPRPRPVAESKAPAANSQPAAAPAKAATLPAVVSPVE